MPRYQITQDITADGVQLVGGQTYGGDDIPAGCLSSMLRLGQAVEVPPEAPKPPAEPPKPTAKK